MRFIEIDRGDAVNVALVSRVTRASNGLAVVHLGPLDQLKTKMPYESLMSLLEMDAPERGVGPSPVATALTY